MVVLSGSYYRSNGGKKGKNIVIEKKFLPTTITPSLLIYYTLRVRRVRYIRCLYTRLVMYNIGVYNSNICI